jgi:hypothetical protein
MVVVAMQGKTLQNTEGLSIRKPSSYGLSVVTEKILIEQVLNSVAQ